ncbi:hypothetical protein IEU95_16100 [Hoyosella rhizosphaerae]|uniref:Secreted protein n=1 Tax=Hoyosella rhizosphaerae TaxID=1755582 RepID=A0A916UIX2_9ACTN|nr:hypothetical protein [Hoyosella rhizosphaerae]MBN4928357.1 hypothetical protein [Hoyosella rhizosphaerae]GGC74334.1 hypothetical protein GCM10011410_29500 [Hoyosella rhizosphaerae]
MNRHAVRATLATAIAAPLFFVAPALSAAAPTAEAKGDGENTVAVTFTNPSNEPASCGALVHFFSTPLSSFGWPPVVLVAPQGTTTQQIPFVSGGIHTVSWWCDVPGEQLHTGQIGPVAVGGASESILGFFGS